jgi:hypothetical protein
MKVYITIILALNLIRFIVEFTRNKNGAQVVSSLLCIASVIVAIVFVWHI